MTADEYLQYILNREAVDTGPFSPVRGVRTVLDPIIREWAGDRLLSMQPSGSFMKGTANKSGTDIDLFISLRADHGNTEGNLPQTVQQNEREGICAHPAERFD